MRDLLVVRPGKLVQTFGGSVEGVSSESGFPEQFIVEIGEENDAAWPRKLLQMLVLSKCRECGINIKRKCAPTPPCGGGVPVP